MIRLDKIAQTMQNLPSVLPQKATTAPIQTIANGKEKILLVMDSLACQNAAAVLNKQDNATLIQKLKTTMNSYLSSHGYKMGPEGRFFKEFEALDASDMAKIAKKHCGSDFIKFHMCGDISAADVMEIANMNGGKYLSYWNENLDELIMLTSRLKSPSTFQNGLIETNFLEIAKKSPAIWDIALDSFINTPKWEDCMAIATYKSNMYHHVNRGLIGGDISSELKKTADSISSTIDRYTIKFPVTVFREDSSEILSSVMTNQGEVDLANILSKALKDGNINSIVSDILQLHPNVTQKAFMSTSFSDRFSRKAINWELTVKPNTKGIFLETLPIGSDGKELELLLQKGSKIDIKDIEFRQTDTPQWFLKGEVSS